MLVCMLVCVRVCVCVRLRALSGPPKIIIISLLLLLKNRKENIYIYKTFVCSLCL